MAWNRRHGLFRGRTTRTILLLLSLAATSQSDGTPPKPLLRLAPEQVEMGFFYSGATIRVEGEILDGSGAIVVVEGAARQESFKRKTRFGPIWINAGNVHVSRAPFLFLCFSSESEGTLLAPETVRERSLDDRSIVAKLEIEPAPEAQTAGLIRSDFLALKRQDGLYQVHPGSVRLGESRDGLTKFAVEFAWPKMAPPATYVVKVLECHDRRITGERSVSLRVVKAGFPRAFAILASQHAALYGLMAVLVASSAGFAIDFVAAKLFGRKRGAVH